jgi:hypothetical protein
MLPPEEANREARAVRELAKDREETTCTMKAMMTSTAKHLAPQLKTM